MKYIIKLLVVVAVFTALLASCGTVAKAYNPERYSKALLPIKPPHQGSAVRHLKHGVYDVEIYQRSVKFVSTTGLIRPSQIEVFDLDNNGTFDVVFLRQRGVWSFGVTSEFRKRHKTIESTIGASTTNKWIRLAATLRRSVAQVPRATIIPHVDPTTPTKKVAPPRASTAPQIQPRPPKPSRPPAEKKGVKEAPEPARWSLPIPIESVTPPRWIPAQ